MSNHSSGNDNIDAVVNKSFLILDQIQESYFPLLEKSIFSENSSDPNNKSKIAKLEFVINQRIKYVEDNCNGLEGYLSKLTEAANEKPGADFLTYRLNQLRGEQKRILTAFKGIKHKRVEKERVEREQEELLTRRFTASTGVDADGQSKGKFGSGSENFVINLDAEGSDRTHKKKAMMTNNRQTAVALSSKLRNQKPLVKRVRTRYLDFSTDFFGMTKVFLKYSCVDWILLFGFSLVILMAVFCFIVWQTTPRHFE